ncbi:MAG: hypothetical protein IPO43_17815 [Rhodoferax sp.]|nr:hypothetical protein [Rhodoferax sp.]
MKAPAVAQIRFVTPVQYRRSTAALAGDLVQSHYDVLPTRENLNLSSGQRSIAGGSGIPRITVNDEGVARADLSRKLIIRFSEPTKFRIRAGQHWQPRSIEIVLEGLGTALDAANAARPSPPPVTTLAAPPAASADLDAKAAGLLAAAEAAHDRADYALAIDQVNRLLELPANASSRRGQELIGLSRLKMGDKVRARSEFEVFLKLYPSGPDAERVQQQLASLGKPAETTRTRPPVVASSSTSGSVSAFYYGGQSRFAPRNSWTLH